MTSDDVLLSNLVLRLTAGGTRSNEPGNDTAVLTRYIYIGR